MRIDRIEGGGEVYSIRLEIPAAVFGDEMGELAFGLDR